MTPNAPFTSNAIAQRSYVKREKAEGLALAGIGIVGLVAGAMMALSASPMLVGAGYGVLGFGVIHAAIGVAVYVIHDRWIDGLEPGSAAWVGRERRRMATIAAQFRVLRVVESGLVIAGLSIAGLAWQEAMPRVAGAAIAIAAEGAFALVYDAIVARRAAAYAERVAPASGAPSSGLAITHSITF